MLAEKDLMAEWDQKRVTAHQYIQSKPRPAIKFLPSPDPFQLLVGSTRQLGQARKTEQLNSINTSASRANRGLSHREINQNG